MYWYDTQEKAMPNSILSADDGNRLFKTAPILEPMSVPRQIGKATGGINKSLEKF
jgi:hypothetical protein